MEEFIKYAQKPKGVVFMRKRRDCYVGVVSIPIPRESCDMRVLIYAPTNVYENCQKTTNERGKEMSMKTSFGLRCPRGAAGPPPSIGAPSLHKVYGCRAAPRRYRRA